MQIDTPTLNFTMSFVLQHLFSMFVTMTTRTIVNNKTLDSLVSVRNSGPTALIWVTDLDRCTRWMRSKQLELAHGIHEKFNSLPKFFD